MQKKRKNKVKRRNMMFKRPISKDDKKEFFFEITQDNFFKRYTSGYSKTERKRTKKERTTKKCNGINFR